MKIHDELLTEKDPLMSMMPDEALMVFRSKGQSASWLMDLERRTAKALSQNYQGIAIDCGLLDSPGESCWNWSDDYPGANYGATGAPFNSLLRTIRQDKDLWGYA